MSHPQIWSRALVRLCGAKPSSVETLAWVLAAKRPRARGAGPDLPSPFLGVCPLSSQYLGEAKHRDTPHHRRLAEVLRLKGSTEMRCINLAVKQVPRGLVTSVWKGCTETACSAGVLFLEFATGHLQEHRGCRKHETHSVNKM